MADTSVLVYVSCAGPKEILSFRLDTETGALDQVGVVSVPGTALPSPSNLPLAFSPRKDMLYAALRSEPFSVSSFAVDLTDGALTYRGTAPLPAAMAYIATNQQGNLLLGASYTEGKLSVSQIMNGVVEGPAARVITTPPKAHCVVAGASANVVYVPSVTGNAILIYHLNPQTTVPEPANPPSMLAHSGSGPRHIAFHPRLDVLYCVNETAGSLAAFTISHGDGALTELQYEALMPPSFEGNARAADVHVTPDGRFVYASVRTTHKIHGFRIDPTSGRMSRVGVFDVAGSPRSFAVDPTGGFLISGGQDENVVVTYAIGPDGSLTYRHNVAVGLNPSWIETLTLPLRR